MSDDQNSQRSSISFSADRPLAVSSPSSHSCLILTILTLKPSDILPNSETLLDYQTMAAQLKEEIKKEFIGEQEQRLRKKITRQLKKEQARGAQMDAEELGRQKFVRMEKQLRQKIEAELRAKIEKELRRKFQAKLDAVHNDENARQAD